MLNDFFGFNGYTREPEGYFSWQHLTFVSFLLLCVIALALFFSRRNRGRDDHAHNRVIMVSAFVMDGVEIVKILLQCTVGGDPLAWTRALPLYLCSIQFITLPIAAFAKGRLKEAAIDFVAMFGLLGAIMGTYCAGQNYASYPVLSFDNVISGFTHSSAGFASLYLLLTGRAGMHRQSRGIAIALIILFSAAAMIANLILDANYMFLMRGDGTPYDILFNLVGGNPVLYPLGVIVLFIAYITLFYQVHAWVRGRKAAASPVDM